MDNTTPKACGPDCKAAAQLERVRVLIARTNPKDTEGYILKAVNEREELLALLKEMTDRYERLEKYFMEETGAEYDGENGTIQRAKDVLRKAEEVR